MENYQDLVSLPYNYECTGLSPPLGFQKTAEHTNMIIMAPSGCSEKPGETGISFHKYKYVSSVSWLKGMGENKEGGTKIHFMAVVHQ